MLGGPALLTHDAAMPGLLTPRQTQMHGVYTAMTIRSLLLFSSSLLTEGDKIDKREISLRVAKL
jgi:hypothetical protein